MKHSTFSVGQSQNPQAETSAEPSAGVGKPEQGIDKLLEVTHRQIGEVKNLGEASHRPTFS